MQDLHLCAKCSHRKPSEHFSKNAKLRSGLASYCKDCNKAYYRENRGRFLEKMKVYKSENPDKIKEMRRNYYARNRDVIKSKSIEYAAANKERKAQYDARRWLTSRAYMLQKNRRFRHANPEKIRMWGARRRAWKRTGYADRVGVDDIIRRDGKICYICREPVFLDLPNGHERKATLDHVLPLSRGGLHSLENVKCACWECNSVKNAKFTPEQTLERVLSRRALKLELR